MACVCILWRVGCHLLYLKQWLSSVAAQFQSTSSRDRRDMTSDVKAMLSPNTQTKYCPIFLSIYYKLNINWYTSYTIGHVLQVIYQTMFTATAARVPYIEYIGTIYRWNLDANDRDVKMAAPPSGEKRKDESPLIFHEVHQMCFNWVAAVHNLLLQLVCS